MPLPVRVAGVLLPLRALPSGRLDQDAYRFVDFLAAAGCRVWQLLPLGPPDSVGSPYSSSSAFACDPNLLAEPEAPVSAGELRRFRERHRFWADDWAAFAGARALADQVRFEREWGRLRAYAGERGVLFGGDLPIYLAQGSCEQLARPELFLEGLVAGAAPDHRHPDGQLWGNPLYDWRQAAVDGYRLFTARLERSLDLHDLLRADHFRGYQAFWAIPAGEPDPAKGRFLDGPGAAPFLAARRQLGRPLPLLAEDLGLITPDVVRLRERLGLPGLGVLVRGFDGPADNPSRPANLRERQAVFTSTHDTDTGRGWYESLTPNEQAQTGLDPLRPEWSLIELACASRCRLAVCQMQDLLGLGAQARMNLPGTVGPWNWAWRLEQGQLEPGLARRLRALLARTDRLG